jgi:predicted transcriptional regulator of viral defense system
VGLSADLLPKKSISFLDGHNTARQHNKITARDVGSIKGDNRNTIKAAIKELVKRGQVEMFGAGKGK